MSDQLIFHTDKTISHTPLFVKTDQHGNIVDVEGLVSDANGNFSIPFASKPPYRDSSGQEYIMVDKRALQPPIYAGSHHISHAPFHGNPSEVTKSPIHTGNTKQNQNSATSEMIDGQKTTSSTATSLFHESYTT